MNQCRICNKTIPTSYNGGPALRCAECRAKQDEQLLNFLNEENDVRSENEYLRNRFYDSENECTKLNYKFHQLKKRYDLLWQRHSVVLNENEKLRKENERLRKGCERLFGKNYDLSEKIKFIK